MHTFIKFISITVAFSMILQLAGCSKDNGVTNGKNEAYNKIVNEVDKVTASFSSGDEAAHKNEPALPLAEEFKNGDDQKKAEIALNLADDMALAQFFDVVTDDMLTMSGQAVKAYPHPLLLNNYAIMLAGNGNAEDSLFFFLQALEQESENPILLTNIAYNYIELDDFNTAEQYAKRALAAAKDFGPAYQVLTTIHLKNNQSVLAAETMVKSAKHCFNDITAYHFDSFLDAVSALDPGVDEYPLKEEFIDELYEIAKENVDTKDVNSNADTPGSQVKIKPFPQIGSAENLINSYRYLEEELDKIGERWDKAHLGVIENGSALSDYLSGSGNPQEGVYPIKKNIRQIYAFEVLESYYDFKLKQSYSRYSKKVENILEQRNNELTKVEENYEPKIEAAEEERSEAGDELLTELFSMFDTEKLPEPHKTMEIALKVPRLQVEEAQQELDVSKRYAESVITEAQNCYNETKQIIEEFWLRSGGLLKYLTDEKIFNLFSYEREMIVYQYISNILGELEQHSSYLGSEKQSLKFLRYDLQIAEQAAAGTASALPDVEQEEEAEYNAGDVVPEIEKEAFSIYPETYTLPDIGLEFSLFGFGASGQYNGDEYKLSLDSRIGSVGGSKEIATGGTTAYAIYGVNAEGNTNWFTDKKVVSDALNSAGKAGKVLGKVGAIGIGFSNGTKVGEFITMDAAKNIKDRGRVYIRETGGNIGLFGRSEKIEVKTYMSGYSTIQKTIKYKFWFGTLETSAN